VTVAATKNNTLLLKRNIPKNGAEQLDHSMFQQDWKTKKTAYAHTAFSAQTSKIGISMQNQPSKYFEFEAGRVYEILSDLGYQLQDFGQYYRTKALYRGGDSFNSLKVWKNSGFCIDYAADKKFPLQELLKHHISDYHKIKEILGGQKVSAPVKIEKKIIMPRIYEPECLDRLLPNYSFYEKRGISKNVQRQYKIGYATTGKMYQRMVFPIYDENSQIIGFSGRHIDYKEENNAPKWKHLGDKQTWVYPYNLGSLPLCREKIDNAAKIMLVESIGDSMVLTEHGLENHLVTFGLGCSPAMQGFLLSKDPEEIVIVGNNDEGPNFDYNRGLVASIKTMMKLSALFPLDKLKIRLPSMNDLGEMHESGVDVAKWSLNHTVLTATQIKEFINNHNQYFAADKVVKFLKKL
jgi:hypothetical protein